MKALLIDDHTLFCDGVAMLVERRLPQMTLRVTHSLAGAWRALEIEPDLRLVLLDLSLPDSTGLQGLQLIREAAPQVPVVVLSADERVETILAALDAGAAGFIPKTADMDTFVDALATVIGGGVHLPRQVTGGALPPSNALSAPSQALGLSPRQLEVLRLLVEGRSNKIIMRELELSESTVKTHVMAIYRRLGVNSRTQAVVAAARLGLRLTH